MSLMQELLEDSMESSLIYRGSSSVKDVVLNIAKMGRGSYLDQEKTVFEDRLLSLQEILADGSSELRKVTGMDLTIQIDPGKYTRKGYSIHVEIPKKGDTPSAIYGRTSDKVMESIISGEVVDTVIGTLDYKNRKVSGYFSTISFTINLGVGLFEETLLEVDELAAVLLHEIGHVWDFLEGLGETSRSVAIASYTKKVLSGNYDIDRKLDLIKKLDPDLGNEVEDPSQVKDEEILTLVAANAFARKSIESKTKTYELWSEEFIADDFATKNGLGYALAKAMAKLEKNRFFMFTDGQYLPIWTAFSGFFRDLRYTVPLGFYLGGAAVGNPLVFPLFMTIIATSLPGNVRIRPKDRLNKVRQGMISALRDPNVPENDKVGIVEDLKLLNDEIKGLRPEAWSAGNWLLETIAKPFTAPNKRYVKTRMTLDGLDNNRLFEMAQRLRIANK